jgi:hypothetical protein
MLLTFLENFTIFWMSIQPIPSEGQSAYKSLQLAIAHCITSLFLGEQRVPYKFVMTNSDYVPQRR